MRAAVYLRVSTPEQEHGWSLDGQYREVRAYCERRGYRVVRRYQDVASGRDPDRPGLGKMIEVGLDGGFDVVVVWKRDRFGRDSLNNALVSRLLAQHGVGVESATTGPQEDTPQTRLMTRVQDALDEYTAENIAHTCQMGRREAAQRGVWPTKPPWGYRRVHETKALIVDEEKAEVVRDVYTMAAEGWTLREITAATGRSRYFLMNMLHRDAYLGRLVYDDIQVDDAWPAIVDADLVERAREGLQERRRNHT